MENKEQCKIKSCCSTHGCSIAGIILLVLATILTLITLNGAGILGLFIAGVVLCLHKNICCKMCHCGCMNNKSACCDVSEVTPPVVESVVEKKTTIDKPF